MFGLSLYRGCRESSHNAEGPQAVRALAVTVWLTVVFLAQWCVVLPTAPKTG